MIMGKINRESAMDNINEKLCDIMAMCKNRCEDIHKEIGIGYNTLINARKNKPVTMKTAKKLEQFYNTSIPNLVNLIKVSRTRTLDLRLIADLELLKLFK